MNPIRSLLWDVAERWTIHAIENPNSIRGRLFWAEVRYREVQERRCDACGHPTAHLLTCPLLKGNGDSDD